MIGHSTMREQVFRYIRETQTLIMSGVKLPYIGSTIHRLAGTFLQLTTLRES